MRLTRLVAGLATAGLVTLSPVVLASAPSSAVPAAVQGSTVSVDPFGLKTNTYGDQLDITGHVTAAGGESPDTGTVSLQISTADSPAFTTIATSADAGYYSFDSVKAIGNATYQVVYSGGTVYNATTNQNDTVSPSASAPQAITVEHKVKLKTDGLKVIGKISPNYGKKKVKIFALKGKKKSKYAKLKTSKSGKFTFRAPNRIGFRFLVVIPATPEFAGTKAAYHVI